MEMLQDAMQYFCQMWNWKVKDAQIIIMQGSTKLARTS